MNMAPEVNPHPGRVPEQELMSTELVFFMAAELGIVFGKILRGLGFFQRDKYVVRMASRGGAQGAQAGWGRNLGWTRAPRSPGHLVAPSRFPSGSSYFMGS